MKAFTPLLRRVYNFTCYSRSYGTRRNHASKPPRNGRPPMDLEPYRETIMEKYKQGATVTELLKWLHSQYVKAGRTTVTKRIMAWGGSKKNILEPHKEVLIDWVRQGIPYGECLTRLEEKGICVSRRTLSGSLSEWNVRRSPRGPLKEELKTRVKLLAEEGLRHDEMLEVLHEEYWFIPEQKLRQVKGEIKREEFAARWSNMMQGSNSGSHLETQERDAEVNGHGNFTSHDFGKQRATVNRSPKRPKS
ncbi:hypothetical protein J1614_007062 [Plenodomus biglobosus]|nr:hypothetical protein J1614_007062 [Plenodomus biglobosus]